MIRIMIETGSRSGEVVAMETADLDLLQGPQGRREPLAVVQDLDLADADGAWVFLVGVGHGLDRSEP
jgi:hypothetical protein